MLLAEGPALTGISRCILELNLTLDSFDVSKQTKMSDDDSGPQFTSGW